MANCFYCGISIAHRRSPSGPHEDWHYSVDHIYSRRYLSELTPEQRKLLSPNFFRLNTVDSCNGCNQMKGRLHPLDWLVIMQDSHGAKRLAERLIKMGTPMAEVFDTMRRRKR